MELASIYIILAAQFWLVLLIIVLVFFLRPKFPTNQSWTRLPNSLHWPHSRLREFALSPFRKWLWVTMRRSGSPFVFLLFNLKFLLPVLDGVSRKLKQWDFNLLINKWKVNLSIRKSRFFFYHFRIVNVELLRNSKIIFSQAKVCTRRVYIDVISRVRSIALQVKRCFCVHVEVQ